MRGAWFRGAGLGIALVLASPVSSLPSGKEKWNEARTPHFRFFSDLGAGPVQDRSRAFEILHEILQVVSPDLSRKKTSALQDLPSMVYLFSRKEEFETYSDLKASDGFFSRHPDACYIAMLATDGNASGVSYHEYLHQYLDAHFGEVPLWLNEGMATFFETMEVDDKVVRLGGAPQGYLRILCSGAPMSVARLLGVTHASPEYQDEALRPKFYAAAWFCTHYLLTADARRRNQLNNYLEGIRSGQARDDCFARAFGCTPEVLDKDVRDALALVRKRLVLDSWILHFKSLGVDPAFTFRELPPSEVLGRLGLLLLPGGANRARSMEHLQAALALDPGSPTGNLGLGLEAFMNGRMIDAGPFFARASLGEPGNSLFHFYAGMAFVERGFKDHAPAPLLEARDHLLAALRLGSTENISATLACLPATGALDGAENLPLFEEACRLRPGDFVLKATLLELYQRASRKGEAGALLQELAAQTEDPAASRRARVGLEALDAAEAERLHGEGNAAFREKRYEDALTRMEEAIRKVPQPTVKQEWTEERDRMKVLIDLRQKAAQTSAGASRKRRGAP